MPEDTKFSTNELVQMYCAVHNLLSENNSDLDEMPLNDPERNNYIEQNKTLNAILRKLKMTLAPAGIDPGKLLRIKGS